VDAALPVCIGVVVNVDWAGHVQVPIVGQLVSQRRERDIVSVNLRSCHEAVTLLSFVDARIHIGDDRNQNVEEYDVRNQGR